MKTLTDSTQVYRKAYVERAEELYANRLKSMRATLAENGMDLNKVAPYPRSNIGRAAYQGAVARHTQFMAAFKSQPIDLSTGITDFGRLDGRQPWLVVEKPGAEADLRKRARMEANSNFDGYLLKLAKKIIKPINRATMTGELWSNCELAVVCLDGEEQLWHTKCIMNFSVYHNMFNQWPTRRRK